ncbi:MAG TPA: NAD(P)-dependent oxidoreductase [Jatrophihabitantaceae bacterium]|nr:NAD(P)-dependent oxidoreductase [Jatrophihabitantaceae bacterium]
MTVLITGSAGTIGTALMRRLPALGWDVRGFDRENGQDITVPADLDAATPNVTAIVHLAGQPTEAPWPAIRDANIEGTFQVFEAARRAGVRRIVYASSNHATGFTPVTSELPADAPPRPDTLYGVSKVFAEALARYYVDRYDMQVACLRIGTFADAPPDTRSLSTWLSPDDSARLVDACLRAPDLTYALVWGISKNTRRTWALDSAFALGYRPQDDAEDHRDAVPEGSAYPSDAFVGGGFTSEGFGIDEVAARS